MIDWRSIDSAPRDGTIIRVMAEEEWFEMRWNPQGSNEHFQPDPVGIWETPDASMTWSEDRGYGPTHWAPVEAGRHTQA